MSRKYLVTGGTGFIGASLVRRLLAEGNTVKVLDNNSRGAHRRLADVFDSLEFHKADIRDPKAVMAAAADVDCICHLAYVNGTEFFYSKPELVMDVAIRGMLNVIDACRAHNVRDLVVASSSEAYQTPLVIPTPEEVQLVVPDPTNPRYSYGGGKILYELMTMNYGRTGFDRAIVFRPHNVYGPDMGWEHVLPQFILRARRLVDEHPTGDLHFPIKGDGTQTRAFCHIDDFTEGLMRVIQEGEHLNIYHIGNPEELTIAQVAAHVVGEFGRKAVIERSQAPMGETNRRCPDISKLSKLGFNPSISFAKGVHETVAWYVANSHLAPAEK